MEVMPYAGASDTHRLVLWHLTGGFALACRWAGIETIQFVEVDQFCQKVLKKNFPGVPIADDITKINFTNPTGNGLEVWGMAQQKSSGLTNGGSKISNGRTTIRLKSTPFILTGGFPCQPFSHAGKRRGKEDDRYLWPDMLRIISEVRPRWVLGENVAGIVNMELDKVLSDLEGLQYETQAFIIPACAVNATHRRDRVWIVGYSKRNRFNGQTISVQSRESRQKSVDFTRTSQDVADTISRGQSGHGESIYAINTTQTRFREATEFINGGVGSQWESEPNVGRVAHGVPNRVDRLKGLGNAIVPQVAYQIIKAIIESENA